MRDENHPYWANCQDQSTQKRKCYSVRGCPETCGYAKGLGELGTDAWVDFKSLEGRTEDGNR